ncbi:MAG: MaoC family dehydratase [Bilifractor sp.]|jgi:acyl dehydratase
MTQARIGIKYCGGCNPRYDRVSEVAALISQFPEFIFQYDTGVYCPVWIVVCGCQSACCPTDDLSGGRILRLREPKDFLRVRGELEQLTDEDVSKMKQALRTCFINETAESRHTFTEKDIMAYAKLTGDLNGIHLDPSVASCTIFRERVVHGQYVSSTLSALMGTSLPGSGTILAEERIRYLHPVRVGDTITSRIRLDGYEEHKSFYVGIFTGTCINQDHLEVIRAEFREIMTKKLFRISEKTPEHETEISMNPSDGE